MAQVSEVFGVRVLSGQWQVFTRGDLYSILMTDDEATADAICKILNDAIAQAQEEGRRQGIVQAAEFVERRYIGCPAECGCWASQNAEQIESMIIAIRALGEEG